MIRNWLRRFIIDILGRRDFQNWRSAEKKEFLSKTREVIILQCDSKLGDAVYLSKIANELINQKRFKLSVIVSEELEEFWKLYVDSANIVTIPRRGFKPTLIRYARIYKKIIHKKSADCLIYLESGEYVDGFFIISALGCKITIGCGKSHFRIFDYSMDDPFFRWNKKNYLEKVSDTLEIFNINYETPLPTPMNCELTADNDNVVFVNTYSAVPERSFNERQILFLTNYLLSAYGHLVSKIFLSIQPGNAQSVVGRTLGTNEKITLVCHFSISQLLQCVKQADFIITPDTGIAHLEGAANSKKLIFYADNFFNPIAWGVSGLVCNAIPSKRQIVIYDISDEELKDYVDKLFSARYWQRHRQQLEPAIDVIRGHARGPTD